MSNWDDLIGLPYQLGKNDCYSCVRNFYRKCGLFLPNYARPTDFWHDPQMDLYGYYQIHGFQPVFDQEPEPGDLLLMPIMAQINSHGAVALGGNEILHHPPGGLSRIDPYRPKWANRTTVHVRHPDVQAFLKPQPARVHLHEVHNAHILRNPDVQEQIALLVSDGE